MRKKTKWFHGVTVLNEGEAQWEEQQANNLAAIMADSVGQSFESWKNGTDPAIRDRVETGRHSAGRQVLSGADGQVRSTAERRNGPELAQ